MNPVAGTSALALLATVLVGAAEAQTQVELVGGAGYSISPGGPPAGLPSVNAGASVGLTTTLQVAFIVSVAPGEKSVSPLGHASASFPQLAGDQRTLSTGNFVHQRLTLRYRQQLGERFGFVVGAGVGSIRFDTNLQVVDTLADVTSVRHRQRWATVAFDLLARINVASPASIYIGLMADTTLDEWYPQPVVLFAVEF